MLMNVKLKIITFVLSVLVLGFASQAMAGVCTVSKSGSGTGDGTLRQKIAGAVGGGCKSDDVEWRKRYQQFYPGVTTYHVVKFKGSMDMYLKEALTIAKGKDDLPIVLIAEDEHAVVIRGEDASSGQGIVVKGDRVIIDNISVQSYNGTGVLLNGDDNVLIRSRVVSHAGVGIEVRGERNRIVDCEIANNGLSGIVVGTTDVPERCGQSNDDATKGAETTIMAVSVHDNIEHGVFIHAPDVVMDSWQPRDVHSVKYGTPAPLDEGLVVNNVQANGGRGVYVSAVTDAYLCREEGDVISLDDAWGAIVAHTTFRENGLGGGIETDRCLYIEGPFPPRVEHLAAVGDERMNEYVVTGTVPLDSFSLNPDAITVEVYLALPDGDQSAVFLMSKDGVDASTGDFTVRLPNPLVLGGREAKAPAFVVRYIDAEHNATSPSSRARGAGRDGDSDGDGLLDSEEDIDGDGIVDAGESDPANPDTDGDGLTDGEERAQLGRIAQLIANGFVFENIGDLDPSNPDSDGDCLPDGLEVGIGIDEAQAIIATMRARPHYAVSTSCRTILSRKSVGKLTNVILYDENAPLALDNIAIIYDTDSATMTDPTDRDTDRDGIMDGEEDWNFNGARDRKELSEVSVANENEDEETASISLGKAYSYASSTGGRVLETCKADGDGWKETDPRDADSDGDGIKDGEEGPIDVEASTLGPNESSPLLCDTDDDGVPDGMELREGTLVNGCDTDGDGLADGIELGIIHPTSSMPGCVGLQAAGTNMRLPTALDPKNPDSDGDGLDDGIEDANHNGWVDASETDPSIPDTDGDGVSDGVETTGDFNGDGLPDFDMRLINNGSDCMPPASIVDLDCDGIPNARDEDSDNDGSPDTVEGGWIDVNNNGIPDMYDSGAVGASPGGGGGGMPSVGAAEEPEQENPHQVPEWALDIGRGGACSLGAGLPVNGIPMGSLILSVIAIFLATRAFRQKMSRAGTKNSL